ncbi:MAG: hypothetical protein RL664_379 [Bacteroidota bacterium]
MKKIYILFFLSILTNVVFSQTDQEDTLKVKSKSFMVGTGVAISLGDLSNNYLFPKISEFGSTMRSGNIIGYNFCNAFGKIGCSLEFQNNGLKGFHVSSNSDTIQYQGSFTSYTYNLTLNSNDLFKLKNSPKLTFNSSIGLGFVTYRSYSYTIPNRVREFNDFYGYSLESNTNANGFESSNLHLENKKYTFVIPVQIQLNYEINDSTSFQFSVKHSSFFSDNIDAGSNKRFNNDRVLYIGVGLTRGINKNSEICNLMKSPFKTFPLSVSLNTGTFCVVGDFIPKENGPSGITALKLLNGKNGLSFGASLHQYIGKKSALSLNYTLTKANGSRNVAFTDSLSQAFKVDISSLSLNYNFDINYTKDDTIVFTITPFVGLGVAGLRSISYFSDDNTIIDSFSYTEGKSFSPIAFAASDFTKKIVFPAGVTLSFPIRDNLNIQATFNNNHYLSDCIDGFVNEISRKDRSYQANLGISFRLK